MRTLPRRRVARHLPAIMLVLPVIALALACSDNARPTSPPAIHSASDDLNLAGVQIAGTIATFRTALADSMCMDVSYGSRSPGTRLDIQSCTGNASQRFSWKSTGELKVYGDSLCVSGSSSKGKNGGQVSIAACTGADSEKWTPGTSGAIINATGGCVTVFRGKTAPGTKLGLGVCVNATSQQWNPVIISSTSPTDTTKSPTDTTKSPTDTTAPAPSPAPAPTPAPSPAPSNAVVLKPGDDIQAAVNNNPAGTAFRLSAGTYNGQAITPKDGDQFFGDAGAILDGQGSQTYAFRTGGTPYPNNVRIHGLVIQNYVPAAQWGAVQAGGMSVSEGAHGWMIDSNEVRYNAAAGINIGNATRIIGNNLHHNGQEGIGGAGDSAWVQGNEIAFNNYQKQYSFGWEAGGAKIAVARGTRFYQNYVHDNWGPGLWCDIDCYDTIFDGNRIENNADAGIFYEISYNAIIRNNSVTGNGYGNAKWLYGAGIFVSTSANVEVYGNTVTNNARGIAGVMQDRGTSKRYGARTLDNLYVHDNVVTMVQGAVDASGLGPVTGVGQDIGDDSYFTSHGNRFVNNTYYLGTRSEYFEWMDKEMNAAMWQGYGQDVTGTFHY